MTQTIETCAGSVPVQQAELAALRMVPFPSTAVTRQFVDNLSEAQRLEALIEGVKPPVADVNLTKLVMSAFRYPPLNHGSRFGGRHEPSLWYGALHAMPMFYEVAYYQCRLLNESPEISRDYHRDMLAYQVDVHSSQHVDASLPPFDQCRDGMLSTESYTFTHQLGEQCREQGVTSLAFPSARDPEHRQNIAVFTPDAIWLGDAIHWPYTMYVSADAVEFLESR